MKEVLTDIQDGTFAKGWIEENETGRPKFNAINTSRIEHQIEVVGAKLREMMPFINEGKRREVVTNAKN